MGAKNVQHDEKKVDSCHDVHRQIVVFVSQLVQVAAKQRSNRLPNAVQGVEHAAEHAIRVLSTGASRICFLHRCHHLCHIRHDHEADEEA